MQTLTLIHSRAFPIARYAEALHQESISPRPVETLEQVGSDLNALRVLLVDPAISGNGHPVGFADPRTAIVGVGLSEQPKWLTDDSIYIDVPADPATAVLLKAVKRAFQALYQKMRADQLERLLSERTRELREVSEVGIALSAERDHSALLTMILLKARELSRADAGSLYLLDEDNGQHMLRWKLAQNDSIDVVSFEEKVLPITRRSLAGYVALTGETLVIDDAYDLPPHAEYTINRSFDEENGYLTRSLLVFPMTNHVGELIGVLQLINRKRAGAPARLTAATVPSEVVSFDDEAVDLMRSLAGQAAVAVENNLLYESIERLFEGFVTAAVTAIEQRDPTTSGHSFRVADLTVEMAKIIDRIDQGQYRHIHFTSEQVREIRYASLLHDFGKVGVREEVLVKAKKLYAPDLALIKQRYAFILRSAEREFEAARANYLERCGQDGYAEFLAARKAAHEQRITELNRFMELIAQSNEPTVLPEGSFEELLRYAQVSYQDLDGKEQPYLTDDETRFLTIRKGSLDEHERLEIESHVTHTYRFLMQIPWTKELQDIPAIAYGHHEKLDGSGYPRRVRGQDIPIQTRMMTIADIFDALTASDRPYKRAVPLPRALDILSQEVKAGMLDPNLFQLFVDARAFDRADDEA